jgi:hypothetical protein
MKTIYKYRLPQSYHGEYVAHRLPLGSTILHVGEQNGQNHVWVELDDSEPEMLRPNRYFAVYYTGGDFPDEQYRRYVGTILKTNGMVHHIYEEEC